MARLPMGTAIARRYVLIRAIGQGGVSTVYSAVDARRGRRRAVKVLAAALAGDRQRCADVRREALIIDRLRHPGVPRVFEYDDAVLPDGSTVPYVVLELLRGVPLTEKLTGGALPWPEAARIAATAAEVLALAHSRGVVHRDLAPRNVMITPAGVKLIDFGLATAAGEEGDRALSHPKTAFADPADDVYTLGVLLYEMLTGRSPYPPAMAATLRMAGRITQLAPTPVLTVPGLPAPLRELVRSCMAKRRDERPAGADIARRLWQLAGQPPVRKPGSAPGSPRG